MSDISEKFVQVTEDVEEVLEDCQNALRNKGVDDVDTLMQVPDAIRSLAGNGYVPIESISKNGTDIPPINKNVDITVPTKTSELINDMNYQTARDVSETIRNTDDFVRRKQAQIDGGLAIFDTDNNGERTGKVSQLYPSNKGSYLIKLPNRSGTLQLAYDSAGSLALNLDDDNVLEIKLINNLGEVMDTKTVTLPINDAVAEEVARIVADAPESFDTLKEIADWISEHVEDASAINSAIMQLRNDIQAKYSKPSDGITKDDLAADVVDSLNKADTAMQSYTETDPTVPDWAKQPTKPSYNAGEVGAPNINEFNSHVNSIGNPHNVKYSQLSDAPNSLPASDVYDWAKQPVKPSYTASEVGLGNVENKSSATIRSEITSDNVTDALGYTPVDSSRVGVNGGIAELDSRGLIPSNNLPSYVDDVLEGTATGVVQNEDTGAITATGFILKGESSECVPEEGKIYIDTTTSNQFRWSGSVFVPTGASIALGETSRTAYRGDRGKTAYDHSQTTTGNPHNVKYSELSDRPTKLSDFDNDAGYLTEETVSAINDAVGFLANNTVKLETRVQALENIPNASGVSF